MKSAVRASGQLFRLSGGGSAFVPKPLPPAIEWTPLLVRTLSDADRRVGQLAGEGARLPNPHLLLRPFLRREAVLSSRIEGTQATLGELLAAEAGAAIERSPDDLREVGNYVTALEYGLKRLRSLPLSLRLVRELHARLLRGVRGGHATPGEFRVTQNWIGPPGSTLETATYVPPPPNEMMDCLNEWEGFLHEHTLPPLVHCGLMHCQFEAIHPFLDGNGRIGRLLITLLLVERRVLPTPLLYLSAYFEATRRDYYRCLRDVTERGAWQDWLQYFLNAVARQSEDALGRSERINRLLDTWRDKVSARGYQSASRLIDLLAMNPFVTAKKAGQQLGVAFTTAQRAIELLERETIIRQVSAGRRDRVYCAQRLMDILDEPPHLTGT